MSMITSSAPLVSKRSPFGATFSESGSFCGTTSVLPFSRLMPVAPNVRMVLVWSVTMVRIVAVGHLHQVGSPLFTGLV